MMSRESPKNWACAALLATSAAMAAATQNMRIIVIPLGNQLGQRQATNSRVSQSTPA
jgi:hypothetical protein